MERALTTAGLGLFVALTDCTLFVSLVFIMQETARGELSPLGQQLIRDGGNPQWPGMIATDTPSGFSHDF